MARLLALVAMGFLLALAGCGGGGDPSSDASPRNSSPSGHHQGDGRGARHAAAGERKQPANQQPAGDDGAPGITVATGDSDYGTILYDGQRRAIYAFGKESSGRSQCYGDCAAAWPPVLTNGRPQGAGHVDPKLLGTTHRDGGGSQVTYAGHPLYFYSGDSPGQVLCQNVVEFGGRWLVVDPGGHAVQ